MKASKWGLTAGLAATAIALAACGSSGGTSTTGNSELFTSAGFQKAYDAVKAKAGGKPPLQVQITQGGADFELRDGERATGFRYTGGELHDLQVQLIGPGSLNGQDEQVRLKARRDSILGDQHIPLVLSDFGQHPDGLDRRKSGVQHGCLGLTKAKYQRPGPRRKGSRQRFARRHTRMPVRW